MKMHWRGFEPLTTRFVAGYSIQLSYQCTEWSSILKTAQTIKFFGGQTVL